MYGKRFSLSIYKDNTGILKDTDGNMYLIQNSKDIKEVCDLLNKYDVDLNKCKRGSMKNKILLMEIIDDLEKHYKLGEPISVNYKYIKWIKDNADLKI